MAEKPRELRPEEQLLCVALDAARREDIHVLADQDIITLFPPMAIMEGFREVPERRADVLEACTGMNRRETARRLPPEVAGQMLETALDAGETNPGEICKAIPAEDIVRYQDPKPIWQLIFKDRWPGKKTPEHQRLMAVLLEAAIKRALLDDPKQKKNTRYELVKAIGIDQFASNRIPEALRTKVLECALAKGEDPSPDRSTGERFTSGHLLDILGPEKLAEYLDLPVLEKALRAVAQKYGWEEADALFPEDIAPEAAVQGEEVSAEELPPDDAIVELDADDPSGVRSFPTTPAAPGGGSPPNPFGHLGQAAGGGRQPAPAMFSLGGQGAMSEGPTDIDDILTGLGAPGGDAGALPHGAHRTPPPAPPRRK